MKYILYHPDNEHKETCIFESFSVGRTVSCGKPAIGQKGAGFPPSALCEKHFWYAAGMDGQSRKFIKTEKKEN